MSSFDSAASNARSGWAVALISLDKRSTGFAVNTAVAMLVLAVFCGLFQVFSRFILDTPSDWTEVLTRFALIWMVYMGVGVALRNGAMVSVDLMHRKLPAVWQKKLEWLIATVTLVMLAVMIYWGAFIAWRIRFQNVAGLEISIAWAYLAIPIGALFAVIAVLAHVFDPLRNELDTAL
ncbi:TRAP transporter small permease [Acidovorax sp. JMULE5]|uniref:TRAP transporter small permease n=1 Tax=Acidovorax sp. JMULE5 TaxID=2518343 RepID=UPI00159FC09D|nr:TRAP transporter small permease [Acidovorax sp. JMULE5]QLA82529.1 TRAP transporter small permease [Acidovorax sp. JMULE5]